MGRRKVSKVIKSPFKLRQRKLSDGRISLFIDFIKNGKHKYEFLNLYLLPETSEKIRRENQKVSRQADEILQERTVSYLITKSEERIVKDLSETPLTEFIDIIIDERTTKTHKRTNQLTTARYNLNLFRPGTKLCDIDKKFCMEYSMWLKTSYRTKWGNLLKSQTAFDYFWQLGIILKNAQRMGYLKSNPWNQLDNKDKVREPEREHRFLTLDEVKLLETTPYKKDMIRRAFLFACFCGLRISDVLNLKWQDIKDGNGYKYLTIIMKKTSKPITIPLTAKALEWLPGKIENEKVVFYGLPCESQIRKHLKKWARLAGISGKFHFHVSRHTYGTMLMTAGVDIYTASKMMGHSDIRATQLYANIIEQKKKEAVNLVDNLF